VASAQTPPTEGRKTDHDALRALMVKSAQALNTRNLDALAGIARNDLTVITVDNQKLVGLEALKKYYAGLFEAPSAIVAKLEVKPTADDLTRFLTDTSGVVYGTSDDIYDFKDGDRRTMKSRWSAVVMKDGDAWKLVNVHFSANVLDNPVLDAAKGYAKKVAIIAAIVGIVVGGLLMALLRRRRGR
jgi:uncharacterized protein (TIGR02246 family)